MKHFSYLIVLLLQVAAAGCNVVVLLWGGLHYFWTSIILYLLSIIVLVFAVVRGDRANPSNCLMVVFFIMNIFFYVLYSFTKFLNDFMRAPH